jgi:Lrp/AsnC family transcriptional regulator for asnA, asnC and gidA
MIIAIQAELGQLETLAQRLAQIPEVRSVDIITGTYDIIIEVALSSTGQLLSFLLDKVVAIPGVKRTDTYHVLKAVKRPSDWTVPEEASAEVGHAGRRSTQSVVPGAIVLPT